MIGADFSALGGGGVYMVMSLESIITNYLRLTRPQFVTNNPQVPVIFSAAATALASRMWVEGIDFIPGVFYIALIGEPRTGKTAFYRYYFKLFNKTNILEIPIGSPESMLVSISEIKHGYIYYDEVAHLAKLLDSYMGTLLPLLNKAYYLDTLSQTRMDKRKSAVVPAESYFVHTYFGGVPSDWALIEKKAIGGFVRRTLVIPVKGIIPYFQARKPTHEEWTLASTYLRWAQHILKLLTYTRITVKLPQFERFGGLLHKEHLENEKKSMVEEYFYKVLAGRLVNSLILVDVAQDPESIVLNDILDVMRDVAGRYGIKIEHGDPSKPPVEIVIDASALDDGIDSEHKSTKITDYIPPHFAYLTYKTLVDAVKVEQFAPDEITTRNVERIKQWLESGGRPVVTMKEFVRKILHTANPQYYEKVLQILEDAGYIRQIQWKYRGRTVRYIILDTSARICANCAKFSLSGECPKLRVISLSDKIYELVRPWDKACEEFEPVEGGDVDE